MDFVTFEIAKKLKEKGFNEYSDRSYTKIGLFNYTETYKESKEFYCYAPTISQVLKWLRKEKKIYVLIEVEYEDWFEYKIVQTIKGIRGSNTRVYETFEEAVLAGIEYVLDNLI